MRRRTRGRGLRRPGDIVNPEVGCKVSVTNENDIVVHLEKALAELVHNRRLLDRLRQQGMTYARERLPWDAKAHDTRRIVKWVLARGPKPDLLPPKALAAGIGSARGKSHAPYAGSPASA